MRLFIALRLSPEMKSALRQAQRAMAAQGVEGRYTPEENLHLTLAFLGEYPDPEAVMAALQGVAFTPFTITLAGLGRFGDLWWAGLAGSAPLEAVARRVRRALTQAGIPFDRKAFSPHITLLRNASRDVRGVELVPARMRVETVSLMRSDRGPSGMVYTQLGSLRAAE